MTTSPDNLSRGDRHLPRRASRISAAQLKAARAFLGVTAQQLAAGSGVGVATIKRAELAESGIEMSAGTTERLLRYLGENGVTLSWSATGGESVSFEPVR